MTTWSECLFPAYLGPGDYVSEGNQYGGDGGDGGDLRMTKMRPLLDRRLGKITAVRMLVFMLVDGADEVAGRCPGFVIELAVSQGSLVLSLSRSFIYI
jgi:hypothetical protein